MLQIGFAGSRQLFDPPPDDAERDDLDSALTAFMRDRLEQIGPELGLADGRYFLCGISQVAIGADTVFTRACGELGLRQRVFLPQHEDAYLAALGSDGRPDFDEHERRLAATLLESEHIVERRLVSAAPDRHARFEDTNREIAAQSDLVICLARAGAKGKPGGTEQLLELARQAGIPALEIRVSLRDGQPRFEERWHDLDGFKAPALPEPLGRLRIRCTRAAPGLPGIRAFADAVKRHFSDRAARLRRLFEHAALAIVGAHIGATLCATLVLAFHPPLWSLVLLTIEVIALVAGFGVHLWLHHARPSPKWAIARLSAEINRSVRSLGKAHLPLDYLFQLRLPPELLPLLRTLNILHLNTTGPDRGHPWQALRDRYVARRLTDPHPKRGQIAYYEQSCRRERRRLTYAGLVFKICTGLAILAAGGKLLVLAHLLQVSTGLESLVESSLGAAAIFLPVLAVGALSWAAAQGYEARVQRFAETAEYLHAQCAALRGANSELAFHRLLRDTELQLLGETAEWYSRRTFGSVA